MKTEKIHLVLLRNDEHFQFCTEFRDLLKANNPTALKVAAQFNAFLLLYKQEDEALKKIMKSGFTDDMQDADKRRDVTFRGMVDANRAALNHFSATVLAAAKRLKIVFDTYGNLAAKPLNEETSAIYNLLQELKGNYAADVATVKLGDWVTELEANNKAFDTLVKERYDETASRTELILRGVRKQVDAAYRSVIERIDAFAVVEDNPEAFATFIRKWNVVVEKYNNTIAQRQGRKKSPLTPEGGKKIDNLTIDN